MYPYSNYNQQQDSRYFSNPQFPEPKSSNSWFGWLLIAIGTGLAGFLLGQRNTQTTEEKPFDYQSNNSSETVTSTIKNDTEVIEVEAEEVVKPNTGSKRLEDLTEEIVNKYVDEFNENDFNLAEKLWYKQQLTLNPELIKKFPKLAQFLGFTD